MNIGDVIVLMVFGAFAVGALALTRSIDDKNRGTEEEERRLSKAKREAEKYGQL